ncbi:MAG: DedA family protein [Nitrospirae bacterium]|nr:DedA family protein [Nitrospirota bacterium]
MEDLISRYGYIAIFILTFFEGESILIAAGFLAYNRYLDANTVVLVSTAASYIGHGTFFLIALHRREAFLKFTQKLIKVNLAKLESLMVRYGIASIFISQWLYGFRLLSAAVLGLSRMGKKKYLTFQLISCLIWATICTYGGYFFGAALKNLLGDIKRYELHIAVGVLAAGFLIWFIRDVRKRKNRVPSS